MPNIITERSRPDLSDCYFYHKMELPGIGEVGGEWDLRGGEAAYLGNQDFKAKSVLEIGTASGHLCFYMEKQGGEVTAYDLSPEQVWDVVPFNSSSNEKIHATRRKHMGRINNSFWLAHHLYESKARAAYGTVYQLNEELGDYDVVTLGSILLHLRDPFLTLQNACARAKETVIITDIWAADDPGSFFYSNFVGENHIKFLPKASSPENWDTWWYMPPNLLVEILKILGFPKIEISFHEQKFVHENRSLFTIVAKRSDNSEESAVTIQSFANQALSTEQIAKFEDQILSSFSEDRLREHLKNRGL